ncbi:Membrane-bound lytic murein transglycosylase F [Vibrio hippocampi]|uniref:Membrane-bound lytic murein transglycosylase F n=1 Tax=Vibrio hippocampi TaxID=654686 RepID=A0ABM8ZJI8_9VIBR|nr:Membrane-bound lytic murein transglycosylase F [Vibrio hippocampi]
MKAILLSLCVLLSSLPVSALELTPLGNTPYTGDLDTLVEKRVVRVLVSADLGFYYIEKGQPKGVGAELLSHFESSLQKQHPKVKVQVIPVPRDDLLPSLVNGYGDLVVANLTITPQRKEFVEFSDPAVQNISEFIVTGSDYPNLESAYDLSGKEVWVRGSSSYFESLQQINQQLQQQGKTPIFIKYLEETIQDYELIEMLKLDYISATVLDSHKAFFWKKTFEDLNIHQDIPIRTDGQIAWAIRKNSPDLLKVINGFIKTAKEGTLLGNVIYQRYMESTSWFSRVLAPSHIAQLEKLASLFKKYADMYDFDFLMLGAMAFQESKLNQNTVSAKGAVGIMQILPSTAKDPNVNIGNINNVENNIHAGTKYLRFLEDRYFSDPEISDDDRVYLSLAAYNAGPGNISRMRTLAKQQGYDPNRWFNHVEVITRRYIGSEPITYVANINRYYVIYKQLASLQQIRREQQANNSDGHPSALLDLYRNATIE